SVHHELYIGGSSRLIAGGRDLIGDVASGNQPLGEGNAVFRQKQDLETPAYYRVTINRGGKIVDELDDQFGQPVGGCRFTGEEERAWNHLQIRILPQAVVKHRNSQ